MMHFSNLILPQSVTVEVLGDDRANWESIAQTLGELEASYRDIVDEKLLSRLLRTVRTRTELKYNFSVEQKSAVAKVLLDIYTECRMSFPMKVSLISCLELLFKKKIELLDCQIPWRRLWDDACSIILRSNKTQSIANDSTILTLLRGLIELIHKVRRYIGASEAASIFNEAQSFLRDIRAQRFAEGMVLMVTCLPTACEHYPQLVELALTTWPLIDNNVDWDMCWLTLLCRARKHPSMASYHWKVLTPLLLSKARQHFQFPAVKGKEPRHAHFAHHFRNLLPSQQIDSHSICCHKVAKILYVSCLVGPLILASPGPITTTPLTVAFAFPGFNSCENIVSSAAEVTSFMQELRPYFYPSNAGPWSTSLAYFVSTFVTEICRHVGKSMSKKMFPSSDVTTIFEEGIHIPTIQFLSGSFLPFIIEELFGKTPMATAFAASCLKNMSVLFPEIVDIFMPIVLKALDDTSVNCSHQAPSAMYAVGRTFRFFMYPRPLMLKYLPDLLRLSVNGIDRNDNIKITCTLGMYISIFSWLPIKKSYIESTSGDEIYPESYISFAAKDCSSQSGNAQSFTAAAAYSSLGPALEGWIPSFLDKVFHYASNKEAVLKGVNKNLGNGVESLICETLEVFFSAVDEEMHAMATKIILDFLTRSLPINASKELGSILSSLVFTNPSALPSVLDVLIDDDIRRRNCSAEKLTFRLDLVSGALRRAADSARLVISTVMPLIELALTFSDKISEKTVAVRKSAGVVLKSLLKGLCSFYPLKQNRNTTSNLQMYSPNSLEKVQVDWYVPTRQNLDAAASLLEFAIVKSLADLSTMLSSLASNTRSSENDSIKKIEESMLSYLSLIAHALVGSADVLGDDNAEQTDKDAGLDTDDRKWVLPSTGRTHLDTSAYASKTFGEIRMQVLKFVLDMNDMIDSAPADSLLSTLNTSKHVRSKLLSIFKLIILRRSATLKDVGNKKKMYAASKRNDRSALAKYMQNSLISVGKYRDQGTPSESNGMFKSRDFWRGHDISSFDIRERARLQFAVIKNEFSSAIIRLSLNSKSYKLNGDLYLRGLAKLVQLCGHNYDDIRNQAISSFTSVANRFGWKLMEFVRPLLLSICTQGTSYASAAGALTIISLPFVMKKIAGRWDLTELFLRCVEGSLSMMFSIDESDKREILLNKLTSAFCAYVSHFHHRPLHLSGDNGNSVEANLFSDSCFKDDNMSSMGMRHASFASYVILHLIGHDDIEIPVGIVKWAINLVTTSMGEPTQIIALAALTKLVYMGAFCRSTLGESVFIELQKSFSKMPWVPFISGLARDHPKSESDSQPQWSPGIDTILRSATYLSMCLPRSAFSSTSDVNMYSAFFKREHAAIFMSILRISGTGIVVLIVEQIILALQAISSTNEQEAKELNSVCAEFFSGVCRAIYVPKDQQIFTDEEVSELERVVLKFLTDSISSISLDYCREYADAIAFGFAMPVETDSLILVSILKSLEHSLASVESDISTTTSEEGFSRQSKLLVLIGALLNADICNCSIVNRETSAVATELLSLFSRESIDIVSPFRTSRDEIGLIVALLTEQNSVVVTDMTSILAKLHSSYFVDQGSIVAISEKIKLKQKNAALTAASIVSYFFKVTSSHRILHVLPSLLRIVLDGCSHEEVEVAKICHEACILAFQGVSISRRLSSTGIDSQISGHLPLLQATLFSVALHSSLHVRETVQLCAAVLLVKQWHYMDVNERKAFRDVFNKGLLDAKPEVQNIAKVGMTSYLLVKPVSELNALAAAYAKNCSVLAERERQRRRNAGGVPESVSVEHTTTVMMTACMILAFPYDVPEYIPVLLVNLARHASVASLKDTVMRTIQEFKRTHQDRWEEFKTKFTREELEDLQGASAMSYYS